MFEFTTSTTSANSNEPPRPGTWDGIEKQTTGRMSCGTISSIMWGRPDRKWTMGVYCDDATCNVLIEGNVFYRVACTGASNRQTAGHDIVVRNNIFIEGYGPAILVKIDVVRLRSVRDPVLL